MVTHAKTNMVQSKQIFDLHVEGLSPIPKSYRGALTNPNWHSAMVDEYSAPLSNNTWDLVDPPHNANIVTGKWIIRRKLKSDGSWNTTKLDGSCVALLSMKVLISMRLSARLLNLL
jgi:hypothetical protein